MTCPDCRHETPGGSAFESEYLSLILARRGCVTRVDLFEVEALEVALKRFEELYPADGGMHGSR